MTGEAIPASDLRLGEASVSLQRVALEPVEGRSANLGAAPCVLLEADPREPRLVAPVAPKEALWIGLMLPAGAEFVSATADGSRLQVDVKAGDSAGAHFVRSVAFGAEPRATRAEVVVRDACGESTMGIELTSVEEFNRRFRQNWRPDPPPASYGGWLLP